MGVVGIAIKGFGKALPKLIKRTLDAPRKTRKGKKLPTAREVFKSQFKKAKNFGEPMMAGTVLLGAAAETRGRKKTNPRTRRAKKK
tara:strand:- start:217 stop:474 length:258 start_codon:yes stop_codon:yes gene_type:complete